MPREPKRTSTSAMTAISKLSKTLETLTKREAYLQHKIDNKAAEAKQWVKRKNRRKAMHCLKVKKLYENELDKISASKMNLERLKITTEGSATNKLVFEGHRAATDTLRAMHKDVNVEAVEDNREAMEELLEDQREISDLMSQPIGDDDMDEDALLAELDGFEEEAAEELLLATPRAPQTAMPQQQQQQQQQHAVVLPSAPSGALPQPATQAAASAAELAELEMLMHG